MLCTKYMRANLPEIAQNLSKKGFELDTSAFEAFESKRRELQDKAQSLQTERNQSSKKIGRAKANGEDIAALLASVADLGDELKAAEHELDQHLNEFHNFILTIPNTLSEDVPHGKSEEDNELLHTWGEPTTFDFEPLDHIELGKRHNWIDFETAAKLSGSRFVVLRQNVARLHRALGQFMLDLHVDKHGYTEHYTPLAVKAECLVGTTQLPKFAHDLFHLKGDKNLSLISTGEIPLTNLARESILDAASLPLKLTTQTACFRSEAGSYGRDTAGMIRQHQFEKVELVQLATPEQAQAAFAELTQHAEAVLQALELPYRAMLLCDGDTSFGAKKTIDLEVWLPGQNTYREISSCSWFGDFQARRMKARFRREKQGKPEYLETINGSGLAVGRTLIAVLENYQQADGSIQVPDALQPYMGGLTVIS